MTQDASTASTDTSSAVEPVPSPGRPSLRKVVFGGSVFAMLAFVSRSLVTFFQVPIALAYMGSESYGLWRVALSALAVLTFVRGGLVPSLKTGLTTAYAREDSALIRVYCSLTILLTLVLVLFSLLLAPAAYAMDWGRYLAISDSTMAHQTRWVFAVLTGATVAGFGLQLPEIILDARLRVALPRVLDFLAPIVGFVLMLLAIRHDATLAVVVACVAIPGPLLKCITFLALRPEERQLSTDAVWESRRVLGTVFHAGLWAMMVQLIAVGLSSVPSLLAARVLGLSSAAELSVAQQFVSYPMQAFAAIMPVLWPAITYSWERGAYDNLSKRMNQFLAGTVILFSVFTVVVMLWGPWFVRVWTSERVNADLLTLLILSIGTMFQTLSFWCTTFLWGTGRLKALVLCHVLAAISLLVSGGLLSIAPTLWAIAVCVSASSFVMFGASYAAMRTAVTEALAKRTENNGR